MSRQNESPLGPGGYEPFLWLGVIILVGLILREIAK